MVKLKRAYEPAAKGDGYRVLVERLWPRGMKKTDLLMDDWLKDLAPSTELRKWFGHDPDRWPEFQRRYAAELRKAAPSRLLQALAERAAHGPVTLLFTSHDAERNNAVVLKHHLERRSGQAPEHPASASP